MRRLTTIIAMLLAPALSLAHVPGADATLGESLSHQLLSIHHLPLTALLLGLALTRLRGALHGDDSR